MPPSKTFDERSAAVLTALEDGASLADGARSAGVGERTVARWLSRGRGDESGYAAFAERVDAIPKARSNLDEVAEPGPVAASLAELLEALELDPRSRVIAETALALARKLDAAAVSEAAATATAAPQLARQLLELLEALPTDRDQLHAAIGELAGARGNRVG